MKKGFLKNAIPSYGNLCKQVQEINDKVVEIRSLTEKKDNNELLLELHEIKSLIENNDNSELASGIHEIRELIEKNNNSELVSEIQSLKTFITERREESPELKDVIANYNIVNPMWGGRISYGEFGEDLMLFSILEGIDDIPKTYIDIGAHHPYAMSNTAYFYFRGWKGINVEANPHLYQEFLKYRPNDVNVNAGCSDKSGIMPFYMFNDIDPRNGFNKDLIDWWLGEDKSLKVEKVIDVPLMTIPEIVEKAGLEEFPSLMSIDIEGNELSALKTLDVNNGPIIVDMEISRDKEEIFTRLEDNYNFLVKIRGNYIFVRKDYFCYVTK